MLRFLKTFLASGSALAVVAIFLTAALTYGLAIPRLGYYHDDWYMLWSGVLRGPNSLIPLFSMDRPFMGVIYAIAYRFIGESLLGWHLYTLAWRIAGAIAFYWILNLAWPKLKGLFTLAAMLFIVYPGFLSIPNAATKINHLTGFGAALFSIAFTLQAIKAERSLWKWILSTLAVLSTAFYLWIYEYMIGLEVMRLSLMFWMYWQGQRRQVFSAIKKVVLAYIPYLLVVGLFLVWRAFIFESTRVATDLEGILGSYRDDFAGLALWLVFQTVKDFFSTTLFAWGVQPYHLFTSAESGDMIGALLLAAGAILLASGYLLLVRKNGSPEADAEQEPVPPYLLVVFGALITLAAVVPVVATIHWLNLLDAYKSYGLHPSPGVIILVVGLATMLKPKFRKPLLIALIALSVATQSLNAQDWARNWEIQKNFWWQLTWRAPAITDDTVLMAYAPDGYAFQQDYEVWGPVNLIYHPDAADHPLIQSEVLNQDTAVDVAMEAIKDRYVRDILLPRDYHNFLLASQPTVNSCIHIIDGQMPLYSPDERAIVEQVGQYSNVDLIETSGIAPTPPESIFGKEPERGWCYYYQQASLARQTGDWQRIGELYDAAAAGGWHAEDSSEYFVFIEGLVNAGRGDLAARIVDNGLRENTALTHAFCNSLASAPDYPESFGYRHDEISQLLCP